MASQRHLPLRASEQKIHVRLLREKNRRPRCHGAPEPGSAKQRSHSTFLPCTLLHTPDQDEHHDSRANHKMGNSLISPPTLNKPRHCFCSLSTSSRPVCPTDEEHMQRTLSKYGNFETPTPDRRMSAADGVQPTQMCDA